MNIKRLAFSALFLFFALFISTLEAEPSLIVVSIEDGDTLLVEINGKYERLQLTGIDAPETVENAKLKHDIGKSGLPISTLLKLGQLATTHLAHLVKPGDQLELITPLSKRDRYGRITALVRNNKPYSLSALMVTDGYATALRRHAPDENLKEQFIKLEQQAFDQQRGLWGEQRSETIAWSGRKI
jgi:micrococcal nuclease